MLLRRIEAVDGPAAVTVILEVRGGSGSSRPAELSRRGDCWTGRGGAVRFRWSGASKARHTRGRLEMRIKLAAGERHELVLELSDREFADEPPDPGRMWVATEEAWSQVVPDCANLIAVTDARHAYAVLRGLTSASGR